MSNTVRKNMLYLLAAVIICGLSIPANALAKDKNRQSDDERPPHSMRQKVDEFLDNLAEKYPEKAEHLRNLRIEEPEEFREIIHGIMAEMRPGKDRKDPEDPRGPKHGRDGKRGKGHGPGLKERVQKKHDEFVEWLGKNYPKVADKLEKLKDINPGEYIKQVTEKQEKYGEIMKTQKKNPEYAKVLQEDMKLKQTRDGLVRKLKNADAEEKEQLYAELKEAVTKRFDIIIKKKEFKYKSLRQKLEKLQKQVDERQAELDKLVQTKDKAVADRMKELVAESEKLNWD